MPSEGCLRFFLSLLKTNTLSDTVSKLYAVFCYAGIRTSFVVVQVVVGGVGRGGKERAWFSRVSPKHLPERVID